MACTSSEHRIIKIKPPSFGAQLIPEQVNSLLVESGFSRIGFSSRVRDLNAGAIDAQNMKTGEVLIASHHSLMRYQHDAHPDLLVNVSIGRDKGDVKLEFYESDSKKLSIKSIDIYEQLKKNLQLKLYDINDFTES